MERLGSEPHCETVCGDAGCQCLTNMYPLDQIDHLTMVTEDGHSLNCFCGAFRSEWLPVSIRTWTPLKLVYSIPHYSWSTKGFSFKSSYSFNNDALCGSKTFTTHSGKHKKNFKEKNENIPKMHATPFIFHVDAENDKTKKHSVYLDVLTP